MHIYTQFEDEVAPPAGVGDPFVERKFPQTFNVRIAIAAFLFSAMYLTWIFNGRSDESARTTFIWITVGVVFLYGAVFLAISETILTLNGQGIRRDSILGAKEIKWTQIAETRYLVKPVRPRIPMGIFGFLIAIIRRRPRVKLKLAVMGENGIRIRITPNVRRAREAIGIILGQTVPPMVAETRARLDRNETVSFGDLALSMRELCWKSQSPIPVSAISRAEIVGRNLQIKCTGRWMTAIKVRSDRIPNVLVLLEILESIAPQLKPPRIDPLARVCL